MSADYTEKTVASRTGYEGKLLSVKEDEVQLPDGRTGVREYVVHPLPTPASGESLAQLGQSASVQLFVDRAQAVRPRASGCALMARQPT
jgi:hypothetical protein